MNVEKTPTQKDSSKPISEQFSELTFTQTDGNSHYASRDKSDLERRKTSVDMFLQHDILLEPALAPTRHDPETIAQTAERYSAMLDELMAKPARSIEDDMLIDRIIDKTAELFRYEELQLAIGATALGDLERHRRIAAEMSVEMIGGIDQPSFNTLLNGVVQLAHNSESQYAKELLELVEVPADAEQNMAVVELDPKTREIIGEDLQALYPGLTEILERDHQDDPVSPRDAVPVFDELLRVAGLGDEWHAKLRENGRAAETSSAKKEVSIGGKRADFASYRDVVAVGFHESVVHAGRSEGIKFSGVHDFEEGLATRLQQIISGEERTPGVQYYLSIGLQAGADRQDEPRNYRDTFEIMWRREALLMEQAGKNVDVQAARSKAQQQMNRTRRGGAVDTRDASYFVGAQKAAEWLNEIAELPEDERRKQLALVLTNKYDPTIPEQAEYVESHAAQL